MEIQGMDSNKSRARKRAAKAAAKLPVAPVVATEPPAPPITPETPPEVPDGAIAVAWGAKVSPEFVLKVVEVASATDHEPSHLMAAMAVCTRRKFKPESCGIERESDVGLLSFTAEEALAIGTTQRELRQMTAMQQLDYVQKLLLLDRSLKVHIIDSLEEGMKEENVAYVVE
jgi:hypothetical protein